MAERPLDLPLAYWESNLEELDGEIARLATLCNVRILDPGALQRVLQNDAAVCGTDNPIAFTKLRSLLMMHLAIREKSVDVFGQAATAQVEDYVIERLKQRFPDLRGE
jgi:hypothetical protein